MANKSYTYDVHWAFKEEGNRRVEDVIQVTATTVQRAISKAVKELNRDGDGGYLDKEDEDFLKPSDLMIIACQNVTKGF